MDSDRQWLFLALAALAASIWFQLQQTESQKQLNSCRTEYQGFRDGVIYGK